MPLLETHGLKLYYSTTAGAIKAVDNVSFTLEKGEALGVVGESGCGKTSLALAIMRLLPRNVDTYEGSLTFEETDLMKFSEDEYRRKVRWKKISMGFQGAMNSLNPVIRVGHQVAEPLLVNGSTDKHEAYHQAKILLETVGLPRDVFNRYPHELSGGMKQRIVIAMSLVSHPQVVILDEPTSALDVMVQAQIMNLLKRLKRELGLSAIFITHDIALASDICDRIAVMYGGEVVELGNADEVLKSPMHPYAQGLLSSIPRLRKLVKPEFIPGAPPDLIRPPVGCRFHPRCKYAFEPCSSKPPPAVHVTARRTIHCWLHVNTHG